MVRRYQEAELPVSVIAGGQFGSEGKGKTSAFVAGELGAKVIIRVGGPNSGHTAVDSKGKTWVFRQLPAGLAGSNAVCILPAGSLIDVDLLFAEIQNFGLSVDQLRIDPKASIVTAEHRAAEQRLTGAIGSTASGTGAALIERISRAGTHTLARDVPALQPYLQNDIIQRLRAIQFNGQRIVIEGTQGFGLSVWQSEYYPFATSRDTTAASFVGEAGLAPHDVDDCIIVIRSFPIRVGGNSGPLPNEIDWATLAKEAALPKEFHERTTATNRVRRVGRFDPSVVREALDANCPHRIVLNHMDYVDPNWRINGPTELSRRFIQNVERKIRRSIDLIGYGPGTLMRRADVLMTEAA